MTREEVFQAALAACDGDDLALAKKLDLTLGTAARTFARWRKGEGPGFNHTMRMLELANLLRQPGEAEAIQALEAEVQKLRRRLEAASRPEAR